MPLTKDKYFELIDFQRLKEVAGALNVPLSKIGWDSNLRLNEVPLP